MDDSTQQIFYSVLKRWKLVVAVALVFVIAAFFYTSKLSTPTYTSTVKFLAYVQDEEKDKNDSGSYSSQTASNTSKMNYAKQMIPTYLALIDTNEFYNTVSTNLNNKLGTTYSSGTIKGAVSSQAVEDTTVFSVTVTTSDANLSFDIANQYTKDVPKVISKSNNGIVNANVVDKPVMATSANNLNYTKNCLIGLVAGLILACAYIILRDMLDIRIKSAEELSERYDIPVLGAIPDFKNKKSAEKGKKGVKSNG